MIIQKKTSLKKILVIKVKLITSNPHKIFYDTNF